MKQRGRNTGAALTAVKGIDASRVDRIEPPAELSEAEVEIWNGVVNDHPAEAFSITHIPIMALYCRHVVRERTIDAEIKAFDPELLQDIKGLRRYDLLLKMAERESRNASSLATRLRITRQSVQPATTRPPNSPGGGKGAKPWDKK